MLVFPSLPFRWNIDLLSIELSWKTLKVIIFPPSVMLKLKCAHLQKTFHITYVKLSYQALTFCLLFKSDSLSAAAAAKLLQSCPTLCDPIDGGPPGSPSLGFSRQEHWSGLHFLLQCMKVKSESEVAQLCPTLSDPMDCIPPGSSVYGIFHTRVLEWGAIAFSEILLLL